MRRLHSQLERFVASAGAGSNPSIGISKLCAQKKAEGYNFAMFTDKDTFTNAHVNLDIHMKPGCWHFTALTELYTVDGEPKYGSENGDTVPYMFSWVVNEEFHVGEYAAKNLLFLKYTTPHAKVLRQKEEKSTLMRYSKLMGGIVTLFDWPQMRAEGYKGVLVSEYESDGQPFGGWNCYPTLAIWDWSLINLHEPSFHLNTGPFEYTE